MKELLPIPAKAQALALASGPVCCALMSMYHTRTVSVTHSPLPSSSHLLAVQPFPVNPSHPCSPNAPETAGQAHRCSIVIASINEEVMALSDEPRSCSAGGSGLTPILSCQFKLSKSQVQSLWLAGRRAGAHLGGLKVCWKTGILPVELGSEFP